MASIAMRPLGDERMTPAANAIVRSHGIDASVSVNGRQGTAVDGGKTPRTDKEINSNRTFV